MTEGLPRLSDVAKTAGVSLATASRVLGGSVYPVSPELRERVVAAAQRLSYVPNAHAQALANALTTTVGLIVHDVSDPYFSEIARGVLQVAGDRDLLVMICNTYRDPERELAYIAALRSQRVRSIVLAGSGFTDPKVELRASHELGAFAAQGGRVALVGRHQFELDAVLPDNRAGAAALARHLAGLGHRLIGVAAGPPTLTTIEDRLLGFREGLAAEGLELPSRQVVHEDFTRAGGHAAVPKLLERAPDITAVFALNDAMAVGVLAALREAGREVPGEISVAGFDDITTARDVTPTLTTVRLPMADMGAKAIELTLDEASESPRRIQTSHDLVARQSTSPPAGQTADLRGT